MRQLQMQLQLQLAVPQSETLNKLQQVRIAVVFTQFRALQPQAHPPRIHSVNRTI